MRIVTLVTLAFFCTALHADVILLRDGTRVEGDLKRGDSGYDVTGADGKVTHVDSGDVQSIQLGKSTGGMSAMEKLASLKRSVESLDDVNKIIGRYNDFIQQNKGTPAATKAQDELAIWQDRFDKHMVKVGGKWVTPDEQEQLIAQSGEILKQAYDLMKSNQLKEADAVLAKALAVDPTNPVGNYLQGVLLFRSDKVFPARKAFEATHNQLPSDAATLNNLAVISWRQNKPFEALGFYCDAMLALPQNKEILNNVAEALAGLKDDFKKNPIAQRTSRLFVEQETQLEATMAQYGWYRWGSIWLDQNQLNDLKKSEKEVKDRIDTLQKQFDDLQKKFRDNEDQIKHDQQVINDIQNSMNFYDPVTGFSRPASYPQIYYDSWNEQQSLQAENKKINDNLAILRDNAKRLEASKPKPKYTGVQNLIGVEGTPKVGAIVTDAGGAPTSQPAPTAPSTQPATPTSRPAGAEHVF